MEYSTSFRHGESADLSQNLLSPAPSDQALAIQGLVEIVKTQKNTSLIQEAQKILVNGICDVSKELKSAALSALVSLKDNGLFDEKTIVNELEVRIEKDPLNVIKALLAFRTESEQILLRQVPRFGDTLVRILLDERKLDIPLLLKVFFHEQLSETSKLACVLRTIHLKELSPLWSHVTLCHKSLVLRQFVFEKQNADDFIYADTLFQDDPEFILSKQPPVTLDFTTRANNFLQYPDIMSDMDSSPLFYGSAVEASVVLSDVFKNCDDSRRKEEIRSVAEYLSKINLKQDVCGAKNMNPESTFNFLSCALNGETDHFLREWLEITEKEEINGDVEHRAAVSCLLGLLPSLTENGQTLALKIIDKYILAIKYRPMCFYTLMRLQLEKKLSHPDVMNVIARCAYKQNASTVANYLALLAARGDEQQKLQALRLAASFCEKFPTIGATVFSKFIVFRGASEEKTNALFELVESIIENHRDCTSIVMPIVDSLLKSNEDVPISLAIRISSNLIGKEYLNFSTARQLIRDKIYRPSRKTSSLAEYAALLGEQISAEDGQEEIQSVHDELWELKFDRDQRVAESVWNALARLFEREIVPSTELKLPLLEILKEIKEYIDIGSCDQQRARGISRFLNVLTVLDLPNVPKPAYTKDTSFSTSAFTFAASLLPKLSKPSFEQKIRLQLFPYEVRERFRSIAYAQNRDKILTEFYKQLGLLMTDCASPIDLPGRVILMAQYRAAVSSLLDTSSIEKSGEKRIDVFLSEVDNLMNVLATQEESFGVLCAISGLIMEIANVGRKVHSTSLTGRLSGSVSLAHSMLERMEKKDAEFCALISYAISRILHDECCRFSPSEGISLFRANTLDAITAHPEIGGTFFVLKSEQHKEDLVHRRWLFPVCSAFGFDFRFANYVETLLKSKYTGTEITDRLKSLRESKDLQGGSLETAIIDVLEQCAEISLHDFYEIVDADLKRVTQKCQTEGVIQAVAEMGTLSWGFDLCSNVPSDFRQLPRDRVVSTIVRFIFENYRQEESKSSLLLSALINALCDTRRPDGRTLPPFDWHKLYKFSQGDKVTDTEILRTIQNSFLRLAMQERVSTILHGIIASQSRDLNELVSEFCRSPAPFLNCLSFISSSTVFLKALGRHSQEFYKNECNDAILTHPVISIALLSQLPRMDSFTAEEAFNPALHLVKEPSIFLNKISRIFDFWILCSELHLGEFSTDPIKRLLDTISSSTQSEQETMIRLWGMNFAGRTSTQLFYAIVGLLTTCDSVREYEGIAFSLLCALVIDLPSTIPMKWVGRKIETQLLFGRLRRSWLQLILSEQYYKNLHGTVSSFLVHLLEHEPPQLNAEHLSTAKFMLRTAFGRHGIPQKLVKEMTNTVWSKIVDYKL